MSNPKDAPVIGLQPLTRHKLPLGIYYGPAGVVVTCPYCGQEHRHGFGLGLRVRHCADKRVEGLDLPHEYRLTDPQGIHQGALTDIDKARQGVTRDCPVCGWSVTVSTDAAAYSATVAHLEEVHGGGGTR